MESKVCILHSYVVLHRQIRGLFNGISTVVGVAFSWISSLLALNLSGVSLDLCWLCGGTDSGKGALLLTGLSEDSLGTVLTHRNQG